VKIAQAALAMDENSLPAGLKPARNIPVDAVQQWRANRHAQVLKATIAARLSRCASLWFKWSEAAPTP
jgi:hypothetical protein